jgi:hypothetical protein
MHKKLFLKIGENVKLAYSNFQHFVNKNLVENVTKLQCADFFQQFFAGNRSKENWNHHILKKKKKSGNFSGNSEVSKQ